MSRKKARANCKECNNILNRPEKIYCNNKCQRDYEWHLIKDSIIETGLFPSEKWAKRFLKEVQGEICAICKMNDWFGKLMPLVLDHIDGNHENKAIDNYRLICPNCDTFTATYKGRNRGNGRFKRRERFKFGLSY